MNKSCITEGKTAELFSSEGPCGLPSPQSRQMLIHITANVNEEIEEVLLQEQAVL